MRVLTGDVLLGAGGIFLALHLTDLVLQHSCCVGPAPACDCCSIYEVQMSRICLCLQRGRLEMINGNCLVMREVSYPK